MKKQRPREVKQVEEIEFKGVEFFFSKKSRKHKP